MGPYLYQSAIEIDFNHFWSLWIICKIQGTIKYKLLYVCNSLDLTHHPDLQIEARMKNDAGSEIGTPEY